MFDLQKPTGRPFLKLDSHRIIDPQSGEVVLYIPEQSYQYATIVKQSADYFQANKQLGAIPSHVLITIATRNLNAAQHNGTPLNHSERCAHYELAGSALIEASFSAAQEAQKSATPHDDVEDRLELVDAGIDAFHHAQESLGWDPTTDRYQRLSLRASFVNAYKDITCGEITTLTAEEIRRDLQRRLRDTININDTTAARGLGGEIRALQYYWNRYRGPGDIVALPATARGDSGHFHRQDTHDLDIIRQQGEGKWEVMVPDEVKRGRIAQASLKRYVSNILHVDSTGTVTPVKTHYNRDLSLDNKTSSLVGEGGIEPPLT